jgi:hypothetical protein
MGARLGPRRQEASWVVSAESGLPTGYAPSECHPELLSNETVISDGADLLDRLNAWRASSKIDSTTSAPSRLTRPMLFVVMSVIMLLLAALYLAGAFLSGGETSSTQASGFLGFAALFAAYSLSLFRLRRVAVTLGWIVVVFSAFWTLFYPAPIVILAWALHLWFVFRLRAHKAILT